ncbi:zinc-dependent alcohol dehydrogenase family protein [Rubrivirga sp. S365]|uniref:Zinc-dependent alcohol dehydrogenase family protein n=1 Tax=Rubrivirga litoralis TaxID=3075598 RepID=A0ABU3BN68_9BACT|nr:MULTISPECIES: zinc-dependent alcohol dehydrogenase family protein [unclassified Rubrivirga]MDT0630727.1 zinc-dependent alcohol dehydrogenase family protein [Rubrivirga sp. F394]MDT7856397.1 zinc-dependent alcohol dehydrogenase family protein [Rubrivirga sp. S365]
MRALRFHEHGRPADVLRLDDVPRPEPGPGEVRIRLTHRPINPSDLSLVRGTYGRSRGLPAVGGNEGAGRVEAVGPGVDGLAVGDRVVKLGEAPTWQEAVVVAAEDALPVPDALSDEDAAQLFVNPLTARLLLDAAPLAAGDVLVQTAGASTVARVVTELVTRRGVRAVAVVRSDRHADRLRALGAAVVVADGDTDEARSALAEAVGEGGAAAVFDPVAGGAGTLALGALREGGTHVVYGALSGEPLAVSPAALIYRGVTVQGVWRTQWASRAPRSEVRSALSDLARLAAEGAFSLPVEAAFDLADGAEAARAAQERGRWGKTLLTG